MLWHRLQSIMFSLLFLALFTLNIGIFQNTTLGLGLLAAYMIVMGWEVGGMFVGREKAILRWWIGVWMLLSVIVIILTISYYLWAIPPTLVWTLILLTPPVVLWSVKRFRTTSFFGDLHDLWHERRHRIPKSVWIIIAMILFLGVLFFTTLAQHPVTDAVRSVWERIPAQIFLLFSLMSALVIGFLWRGRERAMGWVLMSLLVFAMVSVVAIAFPIGFGFDSFIHKATETHLAQFGTITPKPLYYIGQYALVLFVNIGFFIPIDLADTFLVPTLAAILLPCAWYFAAAHITRSRSVAMLTLTGLFFLPLSSFIVTTPQALANLWTLLLILASVPCLLEREQPRLRTLVLPTLATALIHPIAGLPALFYVLLLATQTNRGTTIIARTPRVIRACLIMVACIALPVSFIAYGFLNNQSLRFQGDALDPFTWLRGLNLDIFFENRFSPLLDLVYLYGKNATLLLLLIALWAWIIYRRDISRRFTVVVWMVAVLMVNYLLLAKMLEFTFLIDYERSVYADRLIPLIAFFLAPLVILGLGHFFLNIKERPMILRAYVLTGLIVIASSAFYLNYPRRDAYEMNHGFNVSQADIDAVRIVEDLSQGVPYLALANQSVSAAAIQDVGFRYYGNVFFYPIPTGGELYRSFLAMNETPTRETAKQALALIPEDVPIKTVFFLVNNYWWDAPRVIETAKTTADDWRSLGNGEIYLFRYQFNEESL